MRAAAGKRKAPAGEAVHAPRPRGMPAVLRAQGPAGLSLTTAVVTRLSDMAPSREMLALLFAPSLFYFIAVVGAPKPPQPVSNTQLYALQDGANPLAGAWVVPPESTPRPSLPAFLCVRAHLVHTPG